MIQWSFGSMLEGTRHNLKEFAFWITTGVADILNYSDWFQPPITHGGTDRGTCTSRSPPGKLRLDLKASPGASTKTCTHSAGWYGRTPRIPDMVGGYTDLYLPGRSLSRGSSTCCPHFLALHERLPSLPDAKWCSFSCQKAGVNMEVPRQEIWEILLQFLM